MVGRSIASISDLGGIFTSALRATVNMMLQSNISAIDLPTVLYVLHSMVGRSIASISDLGGIFTSVFCALGQIYWLWTSLPYDIYY